MRKSSSERMNTMLVSAPLRSARIAPIAPTTLPTSAEPAVARAWVGSKPSD